VVRGGPELKRIESAAVAAVAVVISLGAWWWTSLPEPAPEGTGPVVSIVESVPDSRLLVHVAGEVHRPGVVRLAPGTRVVDAIEAAGGATRSAVLAGINLAAPLIDGSQIIVPSALDQRSGSSGDGLVHVNTASTVELETLPGVGPVMAGRIVSHREQHGQFAVLEDLLDVPGIGEATLARLRPLIRIP
jgi:competence protein ComEA